MNSSALRLGIAAALLWPCAVLAQPRTTTLGEYTLRASVVASTDIAAATARQHGLERSPLHSVLNVSLQRAGADSALGVPAEVRVSVKGLLGGHHSLQMREAREGGGVSYVGSFRHEPREVLDFDISATPPGAASPLRLQFRERMGPVRP